LSVGGNLRETGPAALGFSDTENLFEVVTDVKRQVLKRLCAFVLAAGLFLLSIYTHGIKSFDEIYSNTTIINNNTNQNALFKYQFKVFY
jgi:hypothetical protein